MCVDLHRNKGVEISVPRRLKMAGFTWPQMAAFDLATEVLRQPNQPADRVAIQARAPCYGTDRFSGRPSPYTCSISITLTSRYAMHKQPPRCSAMRTRCGVRIRGWVNDGENLGE